VQTGNTSLNTTAMPSGGSPSIAGASFTGGTQSNSGVGGANGGTGGRVATPGTSGGNASGGSISNAGGSSVVAAPLPAQLNWRREGPAVAIEALWGSGPNDIYAAGPSGVLYHSAGDGTWTTQDAKTSSNITGLWGTGPNDIYGSVESNFILHSTGDGKWTHQDYTAGYVFYDIWGSSPTDVYAVAGGATHSTGNGLWSKPPQAITGGPPVLAIWGSSATDVYVTTANANGRTIYHSNGNGTWYSQVSPDVTSLNDIYGVGPHQIYAGGGSIVVFSAGDGTWTPQLTNTTGAIQAVWAVDAGAVYACDNAGSFYRSNGAGLWSAAQAIDATRSGPICDVIWGTSVSNLYVGTSAGIYRGTP
jgi:hypothetical protein